MNALKNRAGMIKVEWYLGLYVDLKSTMRHHPKYSLAEHS